MRMYKRSLLLSVMTLAGIFFLNGCKDSKKDQDAPASSHKSYSKDINKTSKTIIVNVLDKNLYDDCRIKGSINVPYDDVKAYAQKNWNKDTTKVIFYCSSFRCSASLEAAKILIEELGFNKENILAYEGGAAAAHTYGIKMEGPCKQEYLNDIAEKENNAQEQDGVRLISTNDLKKIVNSL